MKKNYKMIIGIIVVFVIICIGIAAYFMLNNKNENEAVTNINMATLNTEIEEKGEFPTTGMQDITKAELTALFDIDENSVDEVIGKFPLINIKASMYVVVKAKDGKAEEIKQKFEEYGTKYEDQWATYLPDQHELVKSRKIGVKGNYVYLIIAEKAEEIKNLIK